MTPKEYQPLLQKELLKIYKEVEIEWRSIKDNKNVYSPAPDIAIGPFAIDARYEDEFDKLLEDTRSKILIESLIYYHNENIKTLDIASGLTNIQDFYYFNRNARCFICIEIENEVSRKHLIGGLVNASALGRIGVLIAWTPEKLKAFLKLRNYLGFLADVGKNTFRTDNILILDAAQFNNAVENAL